MKFNSLICIAILVIAMCISPALASTEVWNVTPSKGGVFNGGFETGSGTATTTSWVGSENYGWYAYRDATAATVFYDANISHSGSKSLKTNTSDNSGRMLIWSFDYLGAIGQKSQHGFAMKSNTHYRVTGEIKTDLANNAYVELYQYDSSGVVGTTTTSTVVSGTSDWTQVSFDIANSDSDVAYGMIALGMTAGKPQSVWFDDITLEEVVTDTQSTAQVVKPVIQGVTSVDNIDQSYNGVSVIGMTTTPWRAQSIIPTKEKVTGFSYSFNKTGSPTGTIIASIETNSTVGFVPSGTIVASTTYDVSTLTTSFQKITFNTPAIVTPGQVYWLVVKNSTTTIWDTGNTISFQYGDAPTQFAYSSTMSSWLTGNTNSYNTTMYYAKNTEDVQVDVNGVTASFISNGTVVGDATGISPYAIVDTDRGMYTWENAQSYTDVKNVTAVFNATAGGSTTTVRPRVINGWATDDLYGHTYYYGLTDGLKREMTWKINFMLPITHLNITPMIYTAETVAKTVDVSSDNANWVTVLTVADAADSWYRTPIQTDVLNGNRTAYIRFTKAAGSNEDAAWNLVHINATLNTTGLPEQSFVNGVNTINISSNGRAISSSLDPSLQANVWLMGQGATVFTPIVQWILNKQTVRVPGDIIVNDTSLNTPTSWQYYWGDGTLNSTTKNATHHYVKRGIYQVSLNASNSAGSNTSVPKQVRVIGYDNTQGSEAYIDSNIFVSKDLGTYTSSRVLSIKEMKKVDCQLFKLCEV